MPAENQNVDLPAGDSRRIVIPMKTRAGGDLPLAGATLRWWVGRGARSPFTEALIVKTIGSGIAVVGSLVTITLEASDTAALPPGSYHHRIKGYFADGTEETLSRGIFRLT